MAAQVLEPGFLRMVLPALSRTLAVTGIAEADLSKGAAPWAPRPRPVRGGRAQRRRQGPRQVFKGGSRSKACSLHRMAHAAVAHSALALC